MSAIRAKAIARRLGPFVDDCNAIREFADIGKASRGEFIRQCRSLERRKTLLKESGFIDGDTYWDIVWLERFANDLLDDPDLVPQLS